MISGRSIPLSWPNLRAIFNAPWLGLESGVAEEGGRQARDLAQPGGKFLLQRQASGVPLQESLAATLCELSGLAHVFFCNSGLEANEQR